MDGGVCVYIHANYSKKVMHMGVRHHPGSARVNAIHYVIFVWKLNNNFSQENTNLVIG